MSSPLLNTGTPTASTDVTGDRRETSRAHSGELLGTELGAQSIERVVAQDLAGEALVDARTTTGAHEQDDLAVGHRPQESFEEVGPEEPGGAGDEQPLAGQRLADHGECLPLGK